MTRETPSAVRETPAYEYAYDVVHDRLKDCYGRQTKAPKYVKKQCRAFLKIADGKDKKWIISDKKVKQIQAILSLMIMPKGLKAQQPFSECMLGYQWLVIIAVLCTVSREDPEKRRYERLVLEVCRKNFKALSLDTPIPTPDGWKTMGDINLGDYVFAQSGVPTQVIGESEIFNKPMYEVEFEDGEVIKASSDHVWTVKTKAGVSTVRRIPKTIHKGTGKRYRPGGWHELTTEDMAHDFVRPRKDRKGVDYKYRVPMNGAVEYPEKELPVDPYLLGVWLGDGCSIYTTITVGEEDADEMMRNLSYCGYRLTYHSSKDRASYIAVDRGFDLPRFDENRFIHRLQALDLIKNKHIPCEYLTASIEQRMELLRGLMDTDGSASLRGQCSFIQKSERLSYDVLELITGLGYKANIKKRDAILNGNAVGKVYFISFFADKDHTPFRLKRKTARLKSNLASRMDAKSIVDIRPIPAEPSKCIMVDDPMHLYLAGRHFTPTHNTYTCGALFILLMLLEPRFSKFYSVAPDGSLSREVYSAITETIKSSPSLYKWHDTERFNIRRDYVQFTPLESTYYPLAYTTSRFDGKLPQAYIADEVGALPSEYAITAMSSGQLNIRNKLGCIISTKYPTKSNPFEDEVDYAKKVLDGVIEDETVFALLYEPDKTKNWMTDDEILRQANPASLVSAEIWEDLLKKRARAIEVPRERENFLTKHCNIIYAGGKTEAYIQIEDFKACKVDEIDWEGRDVYASFDLAMSNDNVAVGMMAEDEDGIIYGAVHTFIPEGRIEQKNREEHLRYEDFIEAGVCTACGNNTIDYSVVEQYILDLEELYGVHVVSVGFDRYNGISSAQKLAEKYTVVEIKQHSSVLGAPTKFFYEKVVNGEFRYTDNRILEINIENAQCTYDTNLIKYVNKKRSRGKIDGAITMIMCAYLVQQEDLNGDGGFVIQT